MSIIPHITHHRPGGFSLLEVLIAILVLSIGLLGLAGMQLQGAEGTNSAYFRSQATLIANELAERLHVNRPAVDNSDYAATNIANSEDHCNNNVPNPWCDSVGNALAESCNPTEMATFDIHSAACGIDERLPTGGLAIACADVDPTDGVDCTIGSPHLITVSWNEVDDGNAFSRSVVIRVLP